MNMLSTFFATALYCDGAHFTFILRKDCRGLCFAELILVVFLRRRCFLRRLCYEVMLRQKTQVVKSWPRRLCYSPPQPDHYYFASSTGYPSLSSAC